MPVSVTSESPLKTMSIRIEKTLILGAGTMGARIAAQLADAGVPCALLDMVPRELAPEETRKGLTGESPECRNRLAVARIDAAKKARPAAFFVNDFARLIRPGNFEGNLDWCKHADW